MPNTIRMQIESNHRVPVALISRRDAEWLGMAASVAGGAIWTDGVGLDELRELGVDWSGAALLASGAWLLDTTVRTMPLPHDLVVRALRRACDHERRAAETHLLPGGSLGVARDAGHRALIAHEMLLALGVEHEYSDPVATYDERQHAVWASHPYRYCSGEWETPRGPVRRQRIRTPSGERHTQRWITPDGTVHRSERKALLACGAPRDGQRTTIARAIECNLVVWAGVGRTTQATGGSDLLAVDAAATKGK